MMNARRHVPTYCTSSSIHMTYCTLISIDPHPFLSPRKAIDEAKKLAEEYPEIKCESYGFGPERCLPRKW